MELAAQIAAIVGAVTAVISFIYMVIRDRDTD